MITEIQVSQALINFNLGHIAEDILSKISLDNINGISCSELELESEYKMYLCLMHKLASSVDKNDIYIEIQLVNRNVEGDTCNVAYRILTLANIAGVTDSTKMLRLIPVIKLLAFQNMKHFKKANQELTDMRAAGETDIDVFLAKRHNKKSSKKAGGAYA